MQTFTIEIEHETDNIHPNHRVVSCTLKVDADTYEQAIELAEAKYFAEESPYITQYAKRYGMSFYSV